RIVELFLVYPRRIAFRKRPRTSRHKLPVLIEDGEESLRKPRNPIDVLLGPDLPDEARLDERRGVAAEGTVPERPRDDRADAVPVEQHPRKPRFCRDVDVRVVQGIRLHGALLSREEPDCNLRRLRLLPEPRPRSARASTGRRRRSPRA